MITPVWSLCELPHVQLRQLQVLEFHPASAGWLELAPMGGVATPADVCIAAPAHAAPAAAHQVIR